MLEAKLEDLRKELGDKHAQNRRDIHAIRNSQQEMLLKQQEFELKLVPVLGIGAMPGLVEKVDEISKTLQELRMAMGKQGSIWDFLARVIPIFISFASLLAMIWVVMHK